MDDTTEGSSSTTRIRAVTGSTGRHIGGPGEIWRGETCAVDTLELVRSAASQRILFLSHAIRQTARPDRITAYLSSTEEWEADPRTRKA